MEMELRKRRHPYGNPSLSSVGRNLSCSEHDMVIHQRTCEKRNLAKTKAQGQSNVVQLFGKTTF
jgi:hypothetical protein